MNVNAQLSKEEFKKQFYKELEKYKEERKTEFEKFREKRNKEFAEMLSQYWNAIKKQNAVKPPVKPEPVRPIIKDNTIKTPEPVKIPIDNIVSIPKPTKRVPLNIPTLPKVDPQSFTSNFYGTEILVHFDEKHKFRLHDIKEKEVSKAWTFLSDGKMNEVINNFLAWREALDINDYIYACLIGKACMDFLGKNSRNEAIVMQAYILTQCGYDLRIARKNSSLIMLLPIKENVYGKNFFSINGKKYYAINDTDEKGEYYTFSQNFSPNSQIITTQITKQIKLSKSKHNAEPTKTFASKKYPDIRITASADRNLINLYNDYPILDWEMYANTPMSSKLEKEIMPFLSSAVSGKSEVEATEILLNFVQTAFKYKTDGEQFGYERPFFVDELFYYPYSDCEDRAILFSYLVRKIVGLDVVLLNYPNHLASAVKFTSYRQGDYINVNGEIFTVCDPTYINAGVGEAMPQFKQTKAKVIILDN